MSWSRVFSSGNVTRSTLRKSRKIDRNVSAALCASAASQLYMYSRSEPPPCFTLTIQLKLNEMSIKASKHCCGRNHNILLILLIFVWGYHIPFISTLKPPSTPLIGSLSGRRCEAEVFWTSCWISSSLFTKTHPSEFVWESSCQTHSQQLPV